jgi:hypothetical protein
MKRGKREARCRVRGVLSRLPPWAGAAALFFRCGSLTPEMPLSGGSGAGNPGTVARSGTVVLAMGAVSSVDEGSFSVLPAIAKANGTLFKSGGSVAVVDQGGLRFIMTEITVANVEARFMLDTSIEPEYLLDHMDIRQPELSSDTHCIVFSGNHNFDAVGRMVDSSVAALRLPVARYSGVGFGFKEYANRFHYDPWNVASSKITMKGTFLYGEVLHDVIVDINYAPQPSERYYLFGGGHFTLSPEDTTHLELRFDADRWFSNINFAEALGNGSLYFDSTGTLNLTATEANPCVWGLQAVIATDFFASGKLVIY